MTPPCAAYATRSSPGPSAAAVRRARRVMTTDCDTPGAVSSILAAAAAAPSDDTPGTISNGRSCWTHQSIHGAQGEQVSRAGAGADERDHGTPGAGAIRLAR